MLDIVVIILVATSVSAWIYAYRMRRKVQGALGRKATNKDLTSLNTWMAVDEAEKLDQERKPLNPR